MASSKSVGEQTGDIDNRTREKLTSSLVWVALIIFVLVLVMCFILIWSGKVEFKDGTSFMLAIFSGVTGLLGYASGYYYSRPK
ncbi:hypothetical protein HYW21_00925 [Candidatus Woesearchaeota archaeon]|nr:hypothetical protein [Candidatus Woesearchaeota archaeon]